MANVLTPAAAYDTADAITAPEDGDDLDAAVIETDLQVLADRARYAHVALQNHIVWDGVFAVRPGGTLTSFTLDIGGIYLAALAAGTVSQVEQAVAATTITQTAIEGGGGTLGAQARWWYVYAFEGSGLEYEISLTAPGVGRRTKLGSATRVYLGCFPTDPNGSPYPLRKTAGRVVYRRSGVTAVTNSPASNGLRVLDRNTPQTSFTAIDLRPVVPPHSRVALLRLTAIGDAAPDNATLALYTDTDNTTASPAAEAYTIDNHEVRLDVEVEIAQAAQSVTYKLTRGAAGAINGYVDVLGFLE